jgi:hypothetical protein
MWRESSIEDKLRSLLSELDISNMLYIYGDPACGCAFGAIGSCRWTSTLPLSQEQLAPNRAIAEVRISVENIFGLNIQI